MILELHILQNFALNNLNRDDTGSPKECEFGGIKRSRISSQCIKRAVREHAAFRTHVSDAGGDLAVRTSWLNTELINRLQKAGKVDDVVEKAAIIISMLGYKLTDKGKTQFMLFIGSGDIDKLVGLAITNWDEISSDNKDLIKKIKACVENTFAADVALFGRMAAGIKNFNVDSACQVAHAFSVNKASTEIDYFTAVDDIATDDSGAGMIGLTEFDSSCFYRYALINLDQLKINLGHNADLLSASVLGFTEAFIKAIPSGKQNSCAAHNPPSYIKVVLRQDNAAISYANAFVSPVKPEADRSISEIAVNKIENYAEVVNAIYGSTGVLLDETICEFHTPIMPVSELIAKLGKQLEA